EGAGDGVGVHAGVIGPCARMLRGRGRYRTAARTACSEPAWFRGDRAARRRCTAACRETAGRVASSGPAVHAPARLPSRSSLTKHTILFLAANPLGTDRLALDREARAIPVELERSGFRDSFELETRWAVEPLDLLRELRKLKPTVVHFSGHGGRGGDRARGS